MVDHVVVVTDSLTVDGGSARVALDSALALAESGTHVTLFAGGGTPSAALSAHPNVRIVSTGQGEALAARNRLGGALRGLWNPKAHAMMRDVLAPLDRTRTVVHVHGWTKALSASVLASVVRARFPLVVTLHEYFTACPTGCLYLHRDRAVCTIAPMSLACMRKNCDSRNYAFKAYRVVRQAIQGALGGVPDRVATFIAVSSFSKDILAPMLPATSRYRRVDNPVDAVRGPRATPEANAPFVFVGRLSAEKGGALLAEAARDAGVPVVFVGEGAERATIARINPAARITGWLDRDAVAALVRGARAVVVPSLWYETLGLVVLEAAALGIPAIVPAETAAADLVRSGETGLAFARGDVRALADGLRALGDDAAVERMSRATYATYWATPRTMDAHVAGLLSTYTDAQELAA
jgi:glycosyltransferase involved in cell wall biosynthesis